MQLNQESDTKIYEACDKNYKQNNQYKQDKQSLTKSICSPEVDFGRQITDSFENINSKSDSIKSEFLQDYQNFMNNLNFTFNIQDYWQKLNDIGIKILPKIQFSEKIILKSISKNQKVLIFNVYFNRFLIEVSIFCWEEKSFDDWQDFNFQIIDFGTFGKICRPRFNTSKNYVLKKLSITQKKSKISKGLIKQIALIKLFSAFQIGTYFVSPFGFDILSTGYANYFGMQECHKVHNLEQIDSQKIKYDLGISLKIMHELQFIHFDIKNSNIMFSQHLNKFVFIDFGITSSIKQSIGYKTYTQFNGSYQFASPQLQKLFQFQKKDYVDLYFNDLHGLRLILESIKKVQPIRSKKSSSSSILNSSVRSKNQFNISLSESINQNHMFNTQKYRHKQFQFINPAYKQYQAGSDNFMQMSQQSLLKCQQFQKDYLFQLTIMYFTLKSDYGYVKQLITINKHIFDKLFLDISQIFLEICIYPIHLNIYVDFFFEKFKKLASDNSNDQRVYSIMNLFKYDLLKQANEISEKINPNVKKKPSINNDYSPKLNTKQKYSNYSQFQDVKKFFNSNFIFEIKTLEQFKFKRFSLYNDILQKIIHKLETFIQIDSKQEEIFQNFINHYAFWIKQLQEFQGIIEEKKQQFTIFFVIQHVQKVIFKKLQRQKFEELCSLYQKLCHIYHILSYDKLIQVILPNYYVFLIQQFQNKQTIENASSKEQVFFKIMQCQGNFIFAFFDNFQSFYFHLFHDKIRIFQQKYQDFIQASKIRKAYISFLNNFIYLIDSYFRLYYANPFKLASIAKQVIVYYAEKQIRKISNKFSIKQHILTCFFILMQSLKRLKNINQLLMTLDFILNNFLHFSTPTSLFKFCSWTVYAFTSTHKIKLAEVYNNFIKKYQKKLKYFKSFKKKVNLSSNPTQKILQNKKSLLNKVIDLIDGEKMASSYVLVQIAQILLIQILQIKPDKVKDYYDKFNALIRMSEIFFKALKENEKNLTVKSFIAVNNIIQQLQKLILFYRTLFLKQYESMKNMSFIEQNPQGQSTQKKIKNGFYLYQKYSQQNVEFDEVIDFQKIEQMRLYCTIILKLSQIYKQSNFIEWLSKRIQFFDTMISLKCEKLEYFIEYYQMKQILCKPNQMKKFREATSKNFPYQNSHQNKVFNLYLLGKQIKYYQNFLERPVQFQSQQQTQQILSSLYIEAEQLIVKVFSYHKGNLFFIFTQNLYKETIQHLLYSFLNRLVSQKNWHKFIEYIIKITKLIQAQKGTCFQTAKQFYSALKRYQIIKLFKFELKNTQNLDFSQNYPQSLKQMPLFSKNLYANFLAFHHQLIINNKIIQRRGLKQFHGYAFFIVKQFMNRLVKEQNNQVQKYFFNKENIYQLKRMCTDIILKLMPNLFSSTNRYFNEYSRNLFSQTLLHCLQNQLDNNKQSSVSQIQQQNAYSNNLIERPLKRVLQKNSSFFKFSRQKLLNKIKSLCTKIFRKKRFAQNDISLDIQIKMKNSQFQNQQYLRQTKEKIFNKWSKSVQVYIQKINMIKEEFKTKKQSTQYQNNYLAQVAKQGINKKIQRVFRNNFFKVSSGK